MNKNFKLKSFQKFGKCFNLWLRSNDCAHDFMNNFAFFYYCPKITEINRSFKLKSFRKLGNYFSL